MWTKCGLNVADVKKERIPSLRSRVRERAKGFSLRMMDAKRSCVCRRTQLHGRGVHSEKVREAGDESETM